MPSKCIWIRAEQMSVHVDTHHSWQVAVKQRTSQALSVCLCDAFLGVEMPASGGNMPKKAVCQGHGELSSSLETLTHFSSALQQVPGCVCVSVQHRFWKRAADFMASSEGLVHSNCCRLCVAVNLEAKRNFGKCDVRFIAAGLSGPPWHINTHHSWHLANLSCTLPELVCVCVQRNFGKCDARFMAAGPGRPAGGYCQTTCGRCSCQGGPCTDIPPGPPFTPCAQQVSLGTPLMGNPCAGLIA